LLGNATPVTLPPDTAIGVSELGAPPADIRKTWAEPLGVKFWMETESPDCAAPLTLTSMTQTFVGLVDESDAA
jgi:hypothetical protein